MKRILVIGGGGYLGSVLTRQLLEQGYEVGIFQRFVGLIPEVESLAKHPNLKLYAGDVRHYETMLQPMRDRDAVIHLTGLVGAHACESDREETININCMATRNVIRACRESNVRQLLFASTCSVYGANDELVSESSPLNPVDYYAKTKIASEADVLIANSKNLNTTVLRMGTIFGLSPRMRFDLVVNLLTAKAYTDRKVTVRGGGQWRPFVHVKDAGMAYLKVLEAPLSEVAGQIYNVGSPQLNLTIGDVGQRIARLVPEAELVIEPSDDDRNYRVNFSKIQNLKYHAGVGLEEGVTEIISEFRKGRFADWHDAKYSTFIHDLRDYYRIYAKSRVTT
jgi:nucleoside-diphosphate-sugar epimerase